jgi:hypothetical protein
MGNLGFQELLLVLVVLGLFIVPVIFFLITLQNTLKIIEPQNRRMQPGNVWLLLIPLFGFVWSFIMVTAIADSCKTQLEQYGIFYEQRPTYNVGIGWAVCLALSIVVGLFSIISLVMLITYWVKVNDVRKQLLSLKEVHERKEDGSIL